MVNTKSLGKRERQWFATPHPPALVIDQARSMARFDKSPSGKSALTRNWSVFLSRWTWVVGSEAAKPLTPTSPMMSGRLSPRIRS
jgi:hypothetical protein